MSDAAGVWKPGLARRRLLQAAAAGFGGALLPRIGFAADAPELMPHVAQVVSRWVGPGKFPGIIASLGLKDRASEYVARGSEGFADPDPVTRDSLFRIYSMTKPITGMAAMMLVDEGKLGLDQPLGEILPRFAQMQVQVTPDGSLAETRPANRAITIRQLVTHTSGLGYAIIQRGPLRQAMIERGIVAARVSRLPVPGIGRDKAAPSLAAFADRLAELPLVYQPGTRWSYSLGLDLMGRVIEVVSGKPFDVFLEDRLFAPAGMTSTFFQVPASEAHRLTTSHAVINAVLIPIDRGADSIFLEKPPYPMGGSGLVSSPRDYDRFLTMLANRGTLGTRRVMSAHAVRLGTGNLLPAGVAGPTLLGPVSGFGAGGAVGLGGRPGSFGWAGAAGTIGAVDMQRGLRSQIYTQFLPSSALPILREYAEALRADLAALMKGRA